LDEVFIFLKTDYHLFNMPNCEKNNDYLLDVITDTTYFPGNKNRQKCWMFFFNEYCIWHFFMFMAKLRL